MVMTGFAAARATGLSAVRAGAVAGAIATAAPVRAHAAARRLRMDAGTPFSVFAPTHRPSVVGSGGSVRPNRARLVNNWIRRGFALIFGARGSPTMRSPSEISSCPTCRSLLADDQRYCLGCGMRVAAHRVPMPARLAPVAATAPAVARRRRPHPRTVAALTLATLGAGVLAGTTASAGTSGAPAAPIYAMAPAATPAPTP